MSNASQSAPQRTITTQEWHRLQDLLPMPQIRSSYVLAALHAYNESAKSEAAQADEACDEAAQAEAQKRFEAYKQGLERLMRDVAATQTADPKALKLVACEHAKLHRALTGYKKTVNPNNQSTRTLIFFINTMIHKQLTQLMRFNPEAFKRYATGAERVFTIKTSTSYLCKAFAADLPQEGSEDYEAAINKKTASFRGTYGHFANLEKLGYAEKYNLDRNNQETDCGTEVVLNIDVWTWFFGGQGASKADIAALCSSTRGNSSQSSTLKVEKDINKEKNTAANAATSSAAGAAITDRESNRSECQSPTLLTNNITEKTEAPGAAAARDEKAIKVAQNIWNKAFSLLFTAENLKADKIRTNKTTPLSIITETSANECKRRSVALVYALIESGLTLQQIENEAITYIETVATQLKEGKRAYLYAPEMWFRLDFKTGTLFNKLQPKPKADTAAQGEAAPSETETYGEYAEWLVAQGLNKLTLRIYQQKWGSAAIEIAAEYVFLTHKNTKKVKNVGGFAQNLFRNMQSVEAITEQLDRLKRKAAPKSGQVLAQIIDAMPTETPQSVVKAWTAARAAGFKNEGKTLILKLQNKRHLDIVESDACIAAFKKAMQSIEIQYRIEYVIE